MQLWLIQSSLASLFFLAFVSQKSFSQANNFEILQCKGCGSSTAEINELVMYRKEQYPYEEELTKSINLSDKLNQGIIKMMEGQENEAEELFRNVYEESNQMGLENILQVPIVFHYARILLKKGNGVLAEQLGKQAAQKSKANYGDVHPIRLLCLHQYAEIQSFQKRNHEAHKLFTEGRNLIRKRQNFVTGYLTENEFLSTRIENEKLLNFQTTFYGALPDVDSIKGNSLFEIASMQKKQRCDVTQDFSNI